MFDSLVIHLQNDAYYLGGRSGSLSWWNHGHSHATAELYEGKDSWISSLGSNKIRSLHNAVHSNLPPNSALYATGFKVVKAKKNNY